MSLADVIRRLLHRNVVKPEIERADRVLDAVGSIRVQVVPNKRFLDDYRRQDHATMRARHR